MALEPQVHPRLIAHLDLGLEVRGIPRRGAPDLHVLGGVGKVAAVEIEQVVVPDPVVWVAAGKRVPDALIDRAGDDAPIRQGKVAGDFQNPHQRRTRPQDLAQSKLKAGRRKGGAEGHFEQIKN